MELLDTTFLIDVLKGKKETVALLKSGKPLITTQICMYEVIRGMLLRGESPDKILNARDLIGDFRVISLADNSIIKAAEISSDLTKKGKMISDCDCLIAGMALANGINKIVTRNVEHFNRIKGIEVETY
ncbi:type II toxin-antitoxin system VapC family toxin [Candidatus Woesearchaeota archaeon]|nr:type II toxin-antitoxin system VapC family toxin [Candidatus Woesearchaeota archaeon]